jgi:hypothetical protein
MRPSLLLLPGLFSACTLPAAADTYSPLLPHSTYYIMFKGEPPLRVIALLTDAENKRLRDVHESVLKADPVLQAEAIDLERQKQALQKRLRDAIIRLDPKLTPALEQLPGPNPVPLNGAEYQKAKSSALAADPTWQPDAAALWEKMAAHQEKVDAA